MSAYVVESDTINQIVGVLKDCEFANSTLGRRGEWPDPANYQLLAGPDHELGFAMLWMNADAVNYRYRESHVYELNYRENTGTLTRTQAYKLIKGFLYQCLEGEVPQRQLYKDLEQFARDIAELIVQDSTLYDKAEWAA